ncbi:MAG: DUF1553 domain-containing protein [Verrucomicrobia bacterium]|nr:DUF1553 domain-containing protein [Verrucomicrobiota bacterium]
MSRSVIKFLLVVTALLLSFTGRSAPGKDAVDFGAEILPIISSKCFHCHGPDEESRKARLRLDIGEEAIKERKGGTFAIKPGDLKQSELINRITSTDPDEVMPPPKEGHPLKSEEIALLKKWIQQGATYDKHWAFKKPVAPAIPKVKGKKWPQNEIDHFVLAKIEAAKLKPSPPAERSTLLRRVSLDLTGLPPTPAEVEAFLKDKSPNAYEKAVDRLLASPRYGERWARMWLDLSRYADSAGYGSDPLRLNIWPFRDWVINAFNRNMPFDQFTTEQLAGDLIENATDEQRVATAFHRNTMTNTEGGTEDEEWRVAAVKDRAEVTAQAWMGLTMGCAQCHTHKFDPITQREYYQFYAFFNQTEDSDKPDERPTLPLPTPEERKKIESLDQAIASAEKTLGTPSGELMDELAEWEKVQSNSSAWIVLEPVQLEATNGTTFTKLRDDSLLAGAKSPDKDTYKLTFRSALTNITAIRLEVLPDESLPAKGPGRAADGNFVLNDLQVFLKTGDTETNLPLRNATADFSEKGFDITKAIDKPAKKAEKKSGWAVGVNQGKSRVAIFETSGTLSSNSLLRFELVQEYGRSNTLGRFRLSVADLPSPVMVIPTNIRKLLEISSTERSTIQKKEIAEWFQQYATTTTKIRNRIADLKKQRDAVKPVEVPIMQDFASDKMRLTHVFNRGNYLEPGEKVSPDFPSAFNPWPAGAPTNRLGVAQWLMSSENPLTARVTANRFWAQIFGRGIVETEEDFGTQGTKPSHPELLDWLALELRDKGWNTKQFLKTIVMSATYQQSSRLTLELSQKDPANYLLARSPRHRLEAEMVRDQALALSALLSPKIGGPSVYPPQPDNLWKAAFNSERTYPTSTGEDRYRRGIYTIWRRTVPHPSMATFDAPSREACAFRRLPTNTPLQAYVTLNDPIYVEAAQALGRRIATEGGTTVVEKIEFGLRSVLSRQPSKQEIASLRELYESELAHYGSNEEAAQKLATDPLGPLPPGLNAAEAAAWTVVANVLLNLDGILMKS